MRQAMIRELPPMDYAATEAINTICTNLAFAGRNLKKIIVTSCVQSEGKSFMTMRIAQNMARRGRRVCLVDADMRRSFLVKRYGMETAGEMTGLAHYLAGQCELDDAIYETDMYGACIIPAGRDVSNPMALIDSPYFGAMLDDLAAAFDVVLVDAPPVGMVIDAAVMANDCDGVVFVVEYNHTRRRDLASAKHQMEQSGCKVLGAIINKVTFDTLSAKKYYNKGYYKQYTSGYERKSDKAEKK
ncbi:MAG: CpsD/CapB family tyrosine-protein kinase [Clostridia bacterium]|nr:CpsD/CapB family tyrosine-protein kinase [Clostridia bacterium]